MTEFYPKISKSKTSEIEQKSVNFLYTLLLESEEVQANLSSNDKTADIDGTIELLSERRICGKISVQIKTYNQNQSNKRPKFNCPTSLFGYAQKVPTEILILFVVDSTRQVIYWKHINSRLISEHERKKNQKTVSIEFASNEILSSQNLNECINIWKSLYKKTAQMLFSNEQLSSENQRLKNLIDKYQSPTLSISSNEIFNIQRFIERLNYLLDYEYPFVKDVKYPNAWKIGLAYVEYLSEELSYLLYVIPKGVNDLLIKEINWKKAREQFKYSPYLSRNCVVNEISRSATKYANNLIINEALKIIEDQRVLFLTEEIAKEYIIDFLSMEYRTLKLDSERLSSLQYLYDKLSIDLHSSHEIHFVTFVSNNREIRIDKLINCILFLMKKGYDTLERQYLSPKIESNSPYTYDHYDPLLSYRKLEFSFSVLPSIYESFLIKTMPILKEKLLLFGKYNIVLINLFYEKNHINTHFQPSITISYLSCREGANINEIIMALNFNHSFYSENKITDYQTFTTLLFNNKPIKYGGKAYVLNKTEGIETRILYDRFFLNNLLYKFLHDRLLAYSREIC